MRHLLIALMLVLFPHQAFANEDRNCSLGLSAGQVSVDPSRFHISSTERRIMQDPHIAASRTVHSDSNVQQISLGCMVTEHWGVDLLAAKGIKFSIDNTIAPSGLAAFEAAHGLPSYAISATVTRTIEADTAYGVMVNYSLPVTSAVKFRLGAGAYRISLNETSQIIASDSMGRSIVVPGPSEKKAGYVPVIAADVEMKISQNVSIFAQAYVPGKGVKAAFAGLKFAF